MKAKREHRILLSERADEVLRKAKALSSAQGDESCFVFPGAKRGKPISDMTLTKLVKGMG